MFSDSLIPQSRTLRCTILGGWVFNVFEPSGALHFAVAFFMLLLAREVDLGCW